MKRKNIIILAICIIIILSIIGFTYGRFTYESETIGSVTTTSRNPFEIGTLAYNIVNNAMHTKDKESTIYSEEPLTTPAKEINREDERTLSVTEDDYGISYYYRGNVKDNYIDFNGMCWRIVRIEGDGSIKLILEDKTSTCKNATGGDNASIEKGTFGYKGEKTEGNPIKADYEKCEKDSDTCIKNKIDAWLNENNFDKKLLKEDIWNIGDTETIYKYNGTGISQNVESCGGDVVTNQVCLYDSRNRLRNGIATLISPEKNLSFKSYVALLTADEVAFAGGKLYTQNKNYYLCSVSSSAILSLSAYYGTNDNESFKFSDVTYIISPIESSESPCQIGTTMVKNSNNIKPSIVLNKDIKLICGDGTKGNAYKIDENPFDEGTLAYSIVNNAINPKAETSTIYSPSPKTIPAQEVSGENERTLSITKDDYGNSYYYRGNVLDNYIDFNGMCWRIVRIEGDGSIKLILEDKTSTCKNATGGENAFIGIGSYGFKTIDSKKLADYENCTSDSNTCMKNKFDNWFNENNFDKKLLKEDIWNLGDQETIYSRTEEAKAKGEGHSESSYRLRLKKNATLKSKTLSSKNTYATDYIATLTADEIVFAGVISSGNMNSNSYLKLIMSNSNIYWLSLSLAYHQVSYDLTYMLSSDLSIFSNYDYRLSGSDNNLSLRPSIVLKEGITLLSGDGTKGNAYKVDENPFDEGTLAYSIVDNAINPKEETSTIYSPSPKTIPAQEVSGVDERTLSITEDTLGRSYYFRGNVNDNYLNFNNMCWRIVRIEGDGSIKLTLEDKTKTCESAEGGENAFIGNGTYGYKTEDNVKKFDYLNCTNDIDTCMKNRLEKWFEEKFKDKKDNLKKDTWYIGDTINHLNDGYKYYHSGSRLMVEHNATLKETDNNFDSYISTLTADEVAFAGARVTYESDAGNHNCYLYLIDNSNVWWRTLTPLFQTSNETNETYDSAFCVYPNTFVANCGVISGPFIRPSIVLNNNIKYISGNGTKQTPYEI